MRMTSEELIRRRMRDQKTCVRSKSSASVSLETNALRDPRLPLRILVEILLHLLPSRVLLSLSSIRRQITLSLSLVRLFRVLRHFVLVVSRAPRRPSSTRAFVLVELASVDSSLSLSLVAEAR